MAALTPTNPPCTFKIYVVAAQGGILSAVRTNGTNTTTEQFNSGDFLVANCAYYFYLHVDEGDSIDFVYNATTNFPKFAVVELDMAVGVPPTASPRTWSLGGGDTPGRSWSLGSGDTLGGTPITVGGVAVDPRSRTWSLGNGDTPNRSWALGGGDTPGRSWSLGGGDTLGGTPITVGGVAVDPRSRTWSLGSGDTPDRSWTLGGGDTPGRSWTLNENDLPQTRPQSKYSAINLAVTAGTSII